MMQLRYQDYDDFIVVNKGFGLRTHQVSDSQFGLVEYLSEKLACPLYVVHRLDNETSGLILFAKSKEAAQKLSLLFESHQIQKTYYFLTNRINPNTQFEIQSYISKEQNQFIQNDNPNPNAKTKFEYVKKIGDAFLWRAYPQSEKPHQIRLHAQKAQIPVLGDIDHGGSLFFRLALHAQSLSFELNQKTYSIESALPDLFVNNSENTYENFLHSCFEKRNSFYDIIAGESFRLVHTESAKIRADIFNDHLWIYDYSENGLSETEKKSCAAFAKAQNFILIIRHMLDRGAGVGGLEKSTLSQHDPVDTWIAKEEKINYVLKTNAGFSPGLFLDQRENKLLVRKMSESKRILNLFCYTAGFSVAAALGQASEVTSVDVSSKFLTWSKENFTANHLDTEKYEFFPQDCTVFLKGAQKRGRKWDFIICDPPTFGRSKESVWKLERNLPDLAEMIWSCLEDKGVVLFTCNYEKMNRDELLQLFLKKIISRKLTSRLPQLSLDFEHTDDLKNLMKGFLLTKN